MSRYGEAESGSYAVRCASINTKPLEIGGQGPPMHTFLVHGTRSTGNTTDTIQHSRFLIRRPRDRSLHTTLSYFDMRG